MKLKVFLAACFSALMLGCQTSREEPAPGLSMELKEREFESGDGQRVQTFRRGGDVISRIVSAKKDGTWRIQHQTFHMEGGPVITHFYNDSGEGIESIGFGAGASYEVFEMADGRFVPVSDAKRAAVLGAREQAADSARRMMDLIKSGEPADSEAFRRAILGNGTPEPSE